jgi:uncharacterized protein YegP (UPF0339 family)
MSNLWARNNQALLTSELCKENAGATNGLEY